MPGFCFSNTDWVSGIIWSVISGLDTTATVTVPVLLLVEPPLLLVPEPPLEHPAIAMTTPATHPAIARLRRRNLDELMRNLHADEDALAQKRRLSCTQVCSF